MAPVSVAASNSDRGAWSQTTYHSRMVYVDETGHDYGSGRTDLLANTPWVNALQTAIVSVIDHYTAFLGTLADIFGLLDPAAYFDSEYVTQGADYYVQTGAKRVVNKFVELYAPVYGTGTTQWYPWAYAESIYLRHTTELYHKGVRKFGPVDFFEQYYTENYYDESALISIANNVYPNNFYSEVATEYAASIGGYELYHRTIDEDTFLEYDVLCTTTQ